jgi:acyl-CoA synthetase (AMP-forming)/AMP-acid ligase II
MAFSMMHAMCGNTHAFVPGFAVEAVLASIAADRVTDVLLVPTMIQMLVDHPALQAGPDLGSLRRIYYGASPISEAVLDRAMAALPGVEFVQAYGMTELSPVATLNHAWYHTAEGRKAGKLRSAGRATLGTEVKIVDAGGLEVARGEVGEVVVRGPNVMLGYWNNPAQSAAAIRDGWMHTGDGAYMDQDGFIFVVDRMKDMIISGAENIFSAEVENAIAAHAGVAACAVIGIPHPVWGETVHAVIVARAGASPDADQIIAHCKARIAGYKCPRSIDFVDALPLSGAGKVLKNKLREPFWSGQQRSVG